jgi:isopentenyl-diphosphate delta-isomerase type 1
MGDELVDICDENNNLLGFSKLKSEAHKTGLWHRAAHIWIYNSKGEIILQLRAKDKSVFPDVWDVSCAGHVTAGEEPIISAIRELEEEIGITVKKKELKFFKIIKIDVIFRKMKNKEFYYVFFLKFDGDIKKLKLQDEEVQEIKFISIDKLKQELKENPDKYLPHGEYWFEVMKEVKHISEKN